MKRKWMTVIGLCVSGWQAGEAYAAVTTLSASKDAIILGTSTGIDSGNASGKGPALFTGADGGSNRKRSLIQFDVASAGIPANAQVTDVTLTLYLAQVGGAGGGTGGGTYPSRTLRLYDLLQNWTEGSSGSPTNAGLNGAGAGYSRVAGDTTWDYATFDPANTATGKWNNGTADLHGGNSAATESGESTFTNFTTLNAPFTWDSAGMAADVQGWLNGTLVNNGWLLKSDLETSPTSFLAFWSKDGAAANTNPAIAPSLTITYRVPEPTTFAWIALSLCALTARTRRSIR